MYYRRQITGIHTFWNRSITTIKPKLKRKKTFFQGVTLVLRTAHSHLIFSENIYIQICVVDGGGVDYHQTPNTNGKNGKTKTKNKKPSNEFLFFFFFFSFVFTAAAGAAVLSLFRVIHISFTETENERDTVSESEIKKEITINLFDLYRHCTRATYGQRIIEWQSGAHKPLIFDVNIDYKYGNCLQTRTTTTATAAATAIFIPFLVCEWKIVLCAVCGFGAPSMRTTRVCVPSNI